MRLLRTDNLEFEEFFDNLPQYAILSHTWGGQEVSYQEMRNVSSHTKAGYFKMKQSCGQAAKEGFKYIWIDTCCIDKTSSAELTEAINSMYRWYQNAQICYVHLADVSKDDGDINNAHSTFRYSRWFARGWTLQELIAPTLLHFYDQKWNLLGTKHGLAQLLSAITRINEKVLRLQSRVHDHPVARRMSWAANRKTTRLEDEAYSLMGIFDVNMPLLYGEGDKAFTRLQEEIMKDSDDHSIFAWKSPSLRENRHVLHGLLAVSPSQFLNSSDIVIFRNWDQGMPFSMTNNGLRINFDMVSEKGDSDHYMAALNCWATADSTKRIGIRLRRLRGDQYARITYHQLFSLLPYGYPRHPSTIFVRKHPFLDNLRDDVPIVMQGVSLFKLRSQNDMRGAISITEVAPIGKWHSSDTAFYAPPVFGSSGVVKCYAQDPQGGRQSFIIIIGLSDTTRPYCLFKHSDEQKPLGYFLYKHSDQLKDEGCRDFIETTYYRVTPLIKKTSSPDKIESYYSYLINLRMETKSSKFSPIMQGLSDWAYSDSDFELMDISMSTEPIVSP